MKISPTNNTKKYVLISILTLVLIIVCTAVYLYTNQARVENHTTNSQSQNENSSPDNTPNADIPQNNTEEESPSGNTLQASITALNQNGNLLQVRVLIEGIFSEGNCKLTLTQGTTTITKSADIQPLPNNSTCKGFDVDTDELKQTGQWSVSIAITTPTKSAVVTQTTMVK